MMPYGMAVVLVVSFSAIAFGVGLIIGYDRGRMDAVLDWAKKIKETKED